METCKRCLDCHLAPGPTLLQEEDPTTHIIHDVWEIRCERHGHVARGGTLSQAVEFWNIYITFHEGERAQARKAS